MGSTGLHNTLRQMRQRAGLSQRALGQAVGVSRQALIAIEAGRQIPSTALSLQLAQALGCRVEDLFALGSPSEVLVQARCFEPGHQGQRVVLGSVAGQWAALPCAPLGLQAADGIVETVGPVCQVRPLRPLEALRRQVLVAGCAPLLGSLCGWINARNNGVRAVWVGASSSRALELLQAGLVHVAGVHLESSRPGLTHHELVLERFERQRMWLVNLTRWSQGLVLPRNNPEAIEGPVDLLRPGLRVVQRQPGAGAQLLAQRLVAEHSPSHRVPTGPLAEHHNAVAQLVRCGAADVGVAIEGVAVEAGLGFVPLCQERFDLIVPAERTEQVPVARLLDALHDPGFRQDMRHMVGYDDALTGDVEVVGRGDC